MQSKISVIIPIFNAEDSISNAIESLRKQTFKDWCAICVNDGSTDNSLNVLNKLKENDERIIVMSQKNAGPAAARMLAYKYINTPYTIYLDADDEYSPDLLFNAYKKAIETNADLVVPNMLIEQKDGSFLDWNKQCNITDDMEISGLEAFSKTFIPWTIHGDPCIKTDLLRKYVLNANIKVNPYNTDEYISRLLFINSTKVTFCKGNYIYNFNPKSITKEFSLKKFYSFETNTELLKLAEEHHVNKCTINLIKEYSFRELIHYQIILFQCKNLSKGQKHEAQKKIKMQYKRHIIYKDDFIFANKKYPLIYKFTSTNGFFLFRLTCFLFSFLKK